MSMQLGEAQIGQGSTGAEVVQLQKILQSQGYNVGATDGAYGPQTQAAVQAFQQAHKLIPDGIVGPLTWAALQGNPVSIPALPTVQAPAPAPSVFSSLMSPTTLMMGVGAVILFSFMGGKKGRRARR